MRGLPGPSRGAALALLAATGCGDVGGSERPLEAAPSRLDFGPVAIGRSRTEAIRLIFRGETPAVVEGLEPDDFLRAAVAPGPVPRVLVPGEAVVVDVTFRPPRTGRWVGDLRLELDPDAGLDPLVVPVSGTGVPNAIRAQPESVDFGRAALGRAVTATVVFENAGSEPQEVQAVGLAPASAPVFSARLTAAVTLAPRERLPVAVRFAPGESGAHEGELLLLASGVPAPLSRVGLFGEGIAAELVAEPEALDFRGVFVGETRRRLVRLRNLGFSARRVDAVSVPSGGGAFEAELRGSAQLPPGGETELEVRYAPTTEGERSGEVVVSAGGLELRIPVRGEAEGDVLPRPRFASPHLRFGEVTVGHATTREVWLEVASAAPLPAGAAVGLVPADADFGLEAPLPEIPGGQWVVVPVELRPRRLGPARAVLGVGTATLALSAEVTGAPVGELAPWPARVDFGRVPRGRAAVRRLVLRSAGPVAVRAPRVELSGPFSLLSDLPEALAPGDAATVRVRFLDRDTLEGRVEGRLVVSAEGGPARLEVPLVAQVRALPVPVPDLEVELAWSEPGADLDLHLALAEAPLLDAPRSAGFCNPQPEWSDPGPDDDPWLDADRVGPGAESIRIDRVRSGRFRVEVTSPDGPDAVASVTVRSGGLSLFVRSRSMTGGTRWTVGALTLGSSTPRFEDDDAGLRPWGRSRCE